MYNRFLALNCRNVINENRTKIAKSESFLPGIHTTACVTSGWTVKRIDIISAGALGN
jgi:hypothetical protein